MHFEYCLINFNTNIHLIIITAFRESSRDSSTRFVANIVQAANRKIRRTAQRISVPSSTTPDTQSLDSTTVRMNINHCKSHVPAR